MFNPARPYLLYASFRRHDFIYTWDLRGDVSSPIQRFQRSPRDDSLKRKEVVGTNQRFRFDVDIGGNWLSVGNQVGETFSVAVVSTNVTRCSTGRYLCSTSMLLWELRKSPKMS